MKLAKKYNGKQLYAIVATFDKGQQVFRLPRKMPFRKALHAAFGALRNHLHKMETAPVCVHCGKGQALTHKCLCSDCLSKAIGLAKGGFGVVNDHHVPTEMLGMTASDYLEAEKAAMKDIVAERDELLKLAQSDGEYWADNWHRFAR